MTRLIIIVVIGILAFASCGDNTSKQAVDNTAATQDTISSVEKAIAAFEDLDIKPRFGGCNDIADPAKLKSCSDKKMAKFISSNLQYPENARKLKIEGKAIVAFIIEPNGSLSDISAISNLGGGIEQEAIRVFELMNEKKLWWVAGMKDGKRQRVKLQLPITFKM